VAKKIVFLQENGVQAVAVSIECLNPIFDSNSTEKRSGDRCQMMQFGISHIHDCVKFHVNF
jgi:hypothetical protein